MKGSETITPIPPPDVAHEVKRLLDDKERYIEAEARKRAVPPSGWTDKSWLEHIEGLAKLDGMQPPWSVIYSNAASYLRIEMEAK